MFTNDAIYLWIYIVFIYLFTRIIIKEEEEEKIKGRENRKRHEELNYLLDRLSLCENRKIQRREIRGRREVGRIQSQRRKRRMNVIYMPWAGKSSLLSPSLVFLPKHIFRPPPLRDLIETKVVKNGDPWPVNDRVRTRSMLLDYRSS